MYRRHIALLVILALAIGIGAAREFLFHNLNYQIDHLANRRAVSYAHSVFQGWVQGTSLQELIILKWSLSILFIAIMLGITRTAKVEGLFTAQ